MFPNAYLNLILIFTGFNLAGTLLFLFVRTPEKPNEEASLSETRTDTEVEQLMQRETLQIIRESQGSPHKKEMILNKVRDKARTFTEERIVLKYLKLNESEINRSQTEEENKVKISQMKMRYSEVKEFIKNDRSVKLLFPTFILTGLNSTYWTLASMLMVHIID